MGLSKKQVGNDGRLIAIFCTQKARTNCISVRIIDLVPATRSMQSEVKVLHQTDTSIAR